MVFTGPINRTHASLIGGAVLEMALTADRIAADAWRNAPTEGFAAGLHEGSVPCSPTPTSGIAPLIGWMASNNAHLDKRSLAVGEHDDAAHPESLSDGGQLRLQGPADDDMIPREERAKKKSGRHLQPPRRSTVRRIRNDRHL